jgi:hypothetical protein
MKRKESKTVNHDPWTDLLNEAAVQPVPLGQVFEGLHVAAPQAGAVKEGLLEELTRLTEVSERKTKS